MENDSEESIFETRFKVEDSQPLNENSNGPNHEHILKTDGALLGGSETGKTGPCEGLWITGGKELRRPWNRR